MSKNLFDLTTEMLQIQDILDNFDGEITDEAKEAEIDRFLAAANESDEQFKKKIDNYIFLMDELNGRASAKKDKGSQLIEAARRDTANAERLKDRLGQAMILMNKEKIESQYHTLKFVGVGGKKPLELNYDSLDDIPEIYKRVSFDIDKDKIREELDAGAELEFAKYGEKQKRLKIS